MQPSNLKRNLRRLGASMTMLLAALAVIAVGELLPPLQAFQRILDTNPSINQALIMLTAGMTAAGVILLAFTQFLVRVPDSSREQTAVALPSEAGSRGRSRRFFYGVSISAGFHD